MKKKAIKRQRRKVGAFVKVKLSKKWHTYARILDDTVFAFYDARSDKELSVEEISSRRILFKVSVMNYAVTSGRWKIVAIMPLQDELKELPKYFIQDELDPSKFFLYHNAKIVPATREECEGLEYCAVWDPEHVEDRLRDYYAGRPNKWYESLKTKN